MAEQVRMTEVTKVYKEGSGSALSRVSLEVDEGEFTAVMGPSGSGKSTLLNLVAGLDRPTTGDVTVAGRELNGMGEAQLARFRRDQIGFVFQLFHLLPNLTAIENLLMPAQLAGRRNSEPRAHELLARLGIEDVAGRYPAKLSGGQQQRVAMGRALINQPALLLADEPTGALDSRTGEQVMSLLAEINREGQTVLLVTHDPKLAARYASRVISVIDGQVVDDVRLVTTQRRTEEVMRVRADEGVSS